MTDDEAFVRAIVDRPGDDRPREEYAAWLAGRGDGRAAYLRAEAEAVRTGDVSRMRELAAELDYVWVARVSRPPAGVCCEHLALSKYERNVEPEEVDEAGAELGVRIPPGLRALLLNYNLGHLHSGPFVLPEPDGAKPLAVDAFVCLNGPEPPEVDVADEIVERTEWLREEFDLGPKLVFLAATFFDTTFVVSCRRSDRGSVLRYESFDAGESVEFRLVRVADSIGAFLAMLQPRAWPLTDV